ncbi:GGDEF domain-containing protein [Pseudohongiella sp.]|uniref:GGDEF domain-containing protein n=1 Tax=marine sediment metagenome TaxID=412755 RepID=A0A0F9Z340_9ZZZZ|nr:GGDEF domain-containing protein [Pseudohongiella sp.]HDZ09213.1 GGDEF domain-containing protein [Pseudohongiella sp.]HEA63359.1 GGDEF domain-containing protein [Pseudohongiella sp.]
MAFLPHSHHRPANVGPVHHQTRLVYAILIIMALYFTVIGSINVFVFASYKVAALDYTGTVGVALALLYFHRSGHLLIASWLVVVVLIGVLLSFIHMAEGRNYSIIWVTILPPVAFFLLGRRAGAWLTGLVFSYVIGFVYLRLPDWPQTAVTLGAWLNIVEVLLAHWFLFRLYERSRAEAFAELEHLSVTDKLTGLSNRSHLDTLLQQEIERHRRSGKPMTLVLCDIDFFKRINDEHGHLTGDKILQEVAEVLTRNMRASDLCGRWGGEEFLIICPDTASDSAAAITTKLGAALAKAPFSLGLRVSLSFGIACQDNSEQQSDQLLRRADDALYEAKRRGRDRAVIATSNSTYEPALTPQGFCP